MRIFLYFHFLLSACLILLSCGQSSSDKTGDIPVIDIIENLGNYEKVPVSQYIAELEYISLETNDNCLFADENLELLVTSTHIFVRGFRYCYAFDRNGQFLGQIGNYGQGPGEFNYLTGFTIDEKNQALYLETFRTLLKYSWDGVFHQTIELPKSIHGSSLHDVFFVRDNLFIGHFPNYKGDLFHNFVLFDDSSEVIKSFDNYVQFNRTREIAPWTDDSMKPYRIGKRIYVKEIANDTLFYLNEQNELIPQLVFDLGKYSNTKEKRESRVPGEINDEIMLPTSTWSMIGTHNHFFFSIRAYNLSGKFYFPEKGKRRSVVIPSGYQIVEGAEYRDLFGIYDIVNQTTQLLDTDPISPIRGFVNDLDGSLSFWPRYYTSDNELVDIWQAEDMKEFLTEEYFAAHEIKDPAAHQKLKELVQKMDEEDNPVIVIGKLRPELIRPNN
ncbi:6-bladed beta-propeller [Parabacteroides sp. OttesenSCG-928-G21]|nr:6-bladed beta-propeller [Parabacteroides sp. OttesenSCG-928-G21]